MIILALVACHADTLPDALSVCGTNSPLAWDTPTELGFTARDVAQAVADERYGVLTTEAYVVADGDLADDAPLTVRMTADEGDEPSLLDFGASGCGETGLAVSIPLVVDIVGAHVEVGGPGTVVAHGLEGVEIEFSYGDLTGSLPEWVATAAADLQADRCDQPAGVPDQHASLGGTLASPWLSTDSMYNEGGVCQYRALIQTVMLAPVE